MCNIVFSFIVSNILFHNHLNDNEFFCSNNILVLDRKTLYQIAELNLSKVHAANQKLLLEFVESFSIITLLGKNFHYSTYILHISC